MLVISHTCWESGPKATSKVKVLAGSAAAVAGCFSDTVPVTALTSTELRQPVERSVSFSGRTRTTTLTLSLSPACDMVLKRAARQPAGVGGTSWSVSGCSLHRLTIGCYKHPVQPQWVHFLSTLLLWLLVLLLSLKLLFHYIFIATDTRSREQHCLKKLNSQCEKWLEVLKYFLLNWEETSETQQNYQSIWTHNPIISEETPAILGCSKTRRTLFICIFERSNNSVVKSLGKQTYNKQLCFGGKWNLSDLVWVETRSGQYKSYYDLSKNWIRKAKTISKSATGRLALVHADPLNWEQVKNLYQPIRTVTEVEVQCKTDNHWRH